MLYEIVWAKQLQFLFGSSIYSITTIISSFFGGMALGSYLFGKWKTDKNPIMIYAFIEIALGTYCLLSFLFFDVIDGVYLSLAHGLIGSNLTLILLIKFSLSFLVLIIPCTLIGGSLPVLSRCLKVTDNNRGNKVGKLYGVNTLGAVSGAFITGFFLIESFGLYNTVLIGACISFIIGVVAFLKGKSGSVVTKEEELKAPIVDKHLYWLSLTAYGVSGFCALGYEIVWTRILLQMLPSSTYTFSLILSLYLLGIGFGSLFGSWLMKKVKSAVVWFSVIQMMLAISVFCSIKISESNVLYNDLISGGWTNHLTAMGIKTASLLFIPCLLMGALFPVMVQWYRSDLKDIGFSVGKIYSVNTIGGIIGSLCAGFIMVPMLGASASLVLFATINLTIGLFFIKEWQFIQSIKKWKYVTASFLIMTIFILYGFTNNFNKVSTPEGYKQLFYKEGPSANVSVYQSTVPGREAIKILKVNGVYQSGGTDDHAMIVQRRQGHLPMLLSQQIDSVLVFGLATGITLATIAEHKKVKHIDCLEIVASQEAAAAYFENENNQILSNKKVRVIIDDGRSYIKTNVYKYDVIVGDLFQISSSGTYTMYSKEHIETCKNRLSDHGLMVQYIPLQQITETNLKSVINTFVHVFPHVQLWLLDTFAQKPVLAIVASPQPIRLNSYLIQQRIDTNDAKTLPDVGYDNPYLVINQCMMQTETVRSYVDDAPLIRLNHPTMEFSAPRILTEQREERIRLMMSNLLEKLVPLGVEVPNEGSAEILEKLSLHAQASKSNTIADLALGIGKWYTSEKVLQEIIVKMPDHFDTRRILGRTNVFIAIDLLKQRKKKEAIDRLEKAKQLGINDIMVEQLLTTVESYLKQEQ